MLLEGDIRGITEEEIVTFVENSIISMTSMIGEDNSDFSRFRNQQNKIYLKLLEKGSSNPNERTSLLLGTGID